MSGKYWDKSWGLVNGCTPISEGCENCWSASMEHRFCRAKKYDCVLTNDKGKFNGSIHIREDRLDIPIKTKKPTVFSVWNDLFHEKVPDNFIAKSFVVMRDNPRHTFLVLTKRPERMLAVAKYHIHFIRYPEVYPVDIRLPDNIYWGITAENQQRLEERLPYLLQVSGKRFLSIEPLLDKVDLLCQPLIFTNIHQVICGAETGHHARPCNLDWIKSIRDQCEQVGIPFFLKNINAKRERILDGQEYNHLVWEEL